MRAGVRKRAKRHPKGAANPVHYTLLEPHHAREDGRVEPGEVVDLVRVRAAFDGEGAVFGHRTRRVAADQRGVLGPVDGDCDIVRRSIGRGHS